MGYQEGAKYEKGYQESNESSYTPPMYPKCPELCGFCFLCICFSCVPDHILMQELVKHLYLLAAELVAIA